MITVRYEKYRNDYQNSMEVSCFSTLKEVADWLFGMVQGEYKKSLWFTNPDEDHLRKGKLRLDGSCVKSCDGKYVYWVEQIEKDGVVIYSTGTFTNGICHWDEEIKQWLRDCRERMFNPQFNFSTNSIAERKEMQIPVNGGHLVVVENPGTDYPGVSICLRTAEGDMIVALVECKAEYSYKQLDVYTYEDMHADDFTRKFSLNIDEVRQWFEN